MGNSPITASSTSQKTKRNSSKTGQYLLYALGEIILVVVGILIALQINNFNEDRKDRKKEQVILKQLKEDYQSNLAQLWEKVEMRREILKSAIDIFKIIDNPKAGDRDMLIKTIATLSDDPTFDPVQNDLINSGNLRLIKNEKLSRLLSNWSSDIVALQEIETDWSLVINEQLEPILSQIGISRDVANSYMNDLDHIWMLDDSPSSMKITIGDSKVRTALSEIVASRDLEGVVSAAITYNQPANIQSVALVKRINEIIELINSEIKID